jgi:hypothetical protein
MEEAELLMAPRQFLGAGDQGAVEGCVLIDGEDLTGHDEDEGQGRSGGHQVVEGLRLVSYLAGY